MNATMTVIVTMDGAGNVGTELALDGELDPVAHGLLYAAALQQLRHAFDEDAAKYAATAIPAELAAFVAAAARPLPTPAAAGVESEWREL